MSSSGKSNKSSKGSKQSKKSIVPVDKGKEEVDSEEVVEKSFMDRLEEFVDSLKDIKKYSGHKGLSKFSELIVMIKKGKSPQRSAALENAVFRFVTDFYKQYREDFLKENLDFITKNKISLAFGKGGVANIPLGEIYSYCMDESPEDIDTIDGAIYFLLQHVCPEEDLDGIMEICSSFEEGEENPSDFMGFIGNMIGKVSSKLESREEDLEGEDGEINKKAVGDIVGDLIGDSSIRDSMNSLLGQVANEDFDVNNILSSLTGMKKK